MSVGLNVDGGSTKWKLLGPDRSVKDILAQHGITPTQVKFIGVSHIHFDHLAQSADFPHAKLFIGADDWMMMKDLPGSRSRYNHGLAPPNSVQPWLDNEENVEQVIGDRDIFGDGSVIMLNTPGHTPGHHSLLVRLESGAILLTGDLYESQQSFENDEVSKYDDNRADKLASHDRFKKIARNMNATVVIQHEPADVVKLPAFPNWAR
jgi:glyoxylase-like metal-dependent hydrolase (beta-lactamase superfamily II)